MSYCVLCVCLRILMSSSSSLPLVVCRRAHVLLCFVCMFTYIDVQVKSKCWTSIYVNIHTKHNKT
jgi:hypothetical protein